MAEKKNGRKTVRMTNKALMGLPEGGCIIKTDKKTKGININPVASALGFLFAKVFLDDADRISAENHPWHENLSMPL
jgi:hypothetical protein